MKTKTRIKVLEFALNDLNVINTLESWRNGLRRIWNIALAEIERFEEIRGSFVAEDEQGKKLNTYALCCKLPYQYKPYYFKKDGSIAKKGESGERYLAPFSQIFNPKNYQYIKSELVKQVVPSYQEGKGKTAKEWLKEDSSVVVTTSELLHHTGWSSGHYYSCPIGVDAKPTVIKNTKFQSLCPVSNNDNLALREYQSTDDFPLEYFGEKIPKELTRIPSVHRRGIIKSLATSYAEYQKTIFGKAIIARGKPQYKKYNELPSCITNEDTKKGNQIEGDYLLSIPYFKKIHVKGLSRRWKNANGSIPSISVIKYVKRANRWYIQLTGEFEENIKDKQNKSFSVIACDLGIYRYATFSGQFPHDGGRLQTNFINNPRWLRENEDKLAELQRALGNKLTNQLILWLNHPSVYQCHISEIIPISSERYEKLKLVKTEKDGVEVIGSSLWQRLKHNLNRVSNYQQIVGTGKKIERLKQDITNLHAQIAKNRRNFQHWLSYWISRNYDVFIAEDGLQDEKLKLKAKMKLDDNGVATQNKANAKSGLSKSLADGAFGQFLQLTQDKMIANGKTFIRFACDGSSYKVFNHDHPKGIKQVFEDGKHPTTKECPICGHRETEMPFDADKDPQHQCSNCGYTCGRDTRPAILMCLLLIREGIISVDDCSDEVKQALELKNNYKPVETVTETKTKRKKKPKTNIVKPVTVAVKPSTTIKQLSLF